MIFVSIPGSLRAVPPLGHFENSQRQTLTEKHGGHCISVTHLVRVGDELKVITKK